ncbi:hypothetical protein [Furfurilactobacillus siliginis]|uniref:Diguanylate cyclase n=1 Tax=Furfurilactobacillus siliginis TaxID=348151 RepID=A0A0R2L1J8_9LACO|nr:hypothetical protein [Furfurilactobacillus siliginis]KRN95425.1 hypothetical protein IV55_GL001883 [Furfurilactobacillus siliginis]GEK29669.1 diguanylate cyclase [Furfurilactobacillus siliginis]
MMTLWMKLLYLTGFALIIMLVTLAIYYVWSMDFNKHPNYKQPVRYFIQPQIDARRNITGYECLPGEQVNDTWQPLAADAVVPLRQVINLLDNALSAVPKEASTLTVHLTPSQLMSRDFPYFAKWAVSKAAPLTLVAEVTIEGRMLPLHRHRFNRLINDAKNEGLELSLTILDAPQRPHTIDWVLPVIDEVRVSAAALTGETPGSEMAVWEEVANGDDYRLVVTNIKTPAEQQLARQLNDVRLQGPLIGQPQDPATAC